MSNKVPASRINEIQGASIEKYWQPSPSVMVLSWELPNGYTITEQCGCVDPSDFDFDIGLELCRKRLRDKVWELEGYLQKQKVYEEAQNA